MEAVWNRLMERLTAEFPNPSESRSLPPDCTDMLSQAIRAFNCKAYDATAMACRASIEAAGWHSLYLRWTGRGWRAHSIPRKKGIVSKVQLEKIRDELVSEGYLPTKLQYTFDRVKNAGDYALHFAEAFVRTEEKSIGESHVKTVKSGKPAEIEPVKLRVSKTEAERLIRATTAILLQLFLVAKARRVE